MSEMTTLHPTARNKPIRRTLKAFSTLLMWIDYSASRPEFRPFTLSFITAALVLSGGAYALSPWFELIVNRSDSLPGFLFLLDKTEIPKCGDSTVFKMPPESRFYREARLIKIIQGCAGDVISVQDREIFINRQAVGIAMPRSSNHKHILFTISEGVIPAGQVYLTAPHALSYDSRYASFGLRSQQELLGRAYRLF